MYLLPPAAEFKCTLTDVRIGGFDDKWTECAAGLLRSTWPRQPLPNFTNEQLRSCSSRFNSLLFVQVSSDIAPEQDLRLFFFQIELLQVRSPSVVFGFACRLGEQVLGCTCTGEVAHRPSGSEGTAQVHLSKRVSNLASHLIQPFLLAQNVLCASNTARHLSELFLPTLHGFSDRFAASAIVHAQSHSHPSGSSCSTPLGHALWKMSASVPVLVSDVLELFVENPVEETPEFVGSHMTWDVCSLVPAKHHPSQLAVVLPAWAVWCVRSGLHIIAVTFSDVEHCYHLPTCTSAIMDMVSLFPWAVSRVAEAVRCVVLQVHSHQAIRGS